MLVGHILRGISWFVFFMGYGRLMDDVILSPEYQISPIIFSGLEITLRARFTIAEEKSKYLHHLKELIKE